MFLFGGCGFWEFGLEKLLNALVVLSGQNSKSIEDCGAESELNLRGGKDQEISGKKY